MGNRKTMQVDDTLTEYEYNDLNQLVSMGTENSLTEYDYDVRGNQISEETTVTTGEEDAEVTSTSTTSMSYAVTGEMISLVETVDGIESLTQENVYNHEGKRISRTENGTVREYYYDSGVVAYTKDGEATSSANVLSPEGAAIGTYRGDDYYTYLNDIQGSTTNLVKADGSLAAAYDYTDFGETTEITGNNFDNQICYTGGIYDKETELYYLNARYYDPATGRFISQDTYRGELNDPGQWHLYAYCANNPINYVDPSGHRYKWNSKIVLKGPKSDYWYQYGKKKTGASKKKLRIGLKIRYEIKCYKLSEYKKKKCDNYVKCIKNCNNYYKKIRQYAISAGIEISTAILLERFECTELADGCRNNYYRYTAKIGEKVFLWRESFRPIKELYNTIKKYGKKY